MAPAGALTVAPASAAETRPPELLAERRASPTITTGPLARPLTATRSACEPGERTRNRTENRPDLDTRPEPTRFHDRPERL